MRTKIKAKYSAVLLIVALLALAVGLFLFGGSVTSASAATATTPKYLLQFDYKYKYTYGSGGGASTSNDDGTAYSAHGGSVSIWGSGASGDGNLPKGGYINSSTVNMSVAGIQSPSMTVTNSSGTKVGSGKTFTMTGLADGMYNVSINFGSRAWTINSRAGASEGMTGTSSFGVDTTAPTISGASTSTTGKYTNTAFTVTASDSASGVKELYMMTPSESSYSVVGTTSKTVSVSSGNGLYRFYAKDNAGNASATYYVYYDTSLPTITLKNSSGATITNGYINTAFNCTASDTGSGVSYLQY